MIKFLIELNHFLQITLFDLWKEILCNKEQIEIFEFVNVDFGKPIQKMIEQVLSITTFLHQILFLKKMNIITTREKIIYKNNFVRRREK
jgi:hypothetical protein